MDQTADARRSLRRLGHILIVEDDAVLALSMEATLIDAGASRIEICHTTEEALAALRRARPAVIVLDIQLADRDDGWALAELVDGLGPDRPRIVFSTGAPERIPTEIAELGPVLTKPYAPADLVRAVGTRRPRGFLSRLRRTAG
ncbi:response regulator [Pelagerythrobacter rhizovicinus]|uniref:Response regulator n=1 Tax=Pelagerythrobacter rhizovicinus TaxID=2268576 RepID=A0A4Q2KMI6_9SPHN|nr:response regulator [Pelagerythrobacter rhizovicinus]RXZ64371.1 response regulator [Pelagerythrobacter rhizovicinus]